MTVYANVGHILLKRGNTVQSSAYTGPVGELTFDTGLFAVRAHNGVTPGGNVLLENSNQFTANLGTAAANITTLFANAAVQANLINTINANIIAVNAAIITANTTQSSQIVVLQSQLTGANAAIVTANTALKSYTDNQISTAINDLINSAPGTLDTLGEISANLLSSNSAIGSIVNSITSTNANVTAANAAIVTANTAMKGYVDAVTTAWTSNAASQAGSITTLQTQVYANANVASYLPTYTGNIGNVITTSNVITSGYFVGNGALLTGLTSASYDLIRTDTFVLDLPNPAPPETRWANITLNNECGQLIFQRVSGASNYNYLTYTLDGSDPLTSPTAISVYLPNGTSQRINVLGGSVLKTTPTGGDNFSGAILTFYQYRAYYINSYNNANVEAYIGANIGTLYSNAATQATSINAITANIGSFYTYANANAATQATGINTINANIGAYQTYANATQATGINTINANVGAYQTYANAQVQTINANLGDFQTYSNTNAAVQASSLTNLNSAFVNLAANINAIITGTGFATTAGLNAANVNIDALGANITAANLVIAGQTTSINTINANLGAYQTYGNLTFSSIANAATQATSINTINANLGAYQTYGNLTFSTVANAATQQTTIDAINANIGAYYAFANANAAGQTTSITSLNNGLTSANSAITALQSTVVGLSAQNIYGNANVQAYIGANVGAYQIYANANIGTLYNTNISTQANIGSFQTYANVHFTDSSYGNANVASYLPTYTGNITAANISLTGNTGFPANISTVLAWARVTIGTTAYWTPLYQ